ncbi:pyridoxal phosphate-dependent aminotransferase [Rhodobacteraceae bacterium NNCM2]|nr:pyridoxal phosphate-dependent aminotransferase [Coraliihabitans acroporae]
MKISDRINGIVQGGDDGWSVYYRARAMKQDGKPVIMLSIGDHDIKTDRTILDAMCASMDAGNLGYSPVSGSMGLRGAIAERVTARTATPATADNIVVTPGGQSALYSAMIATLDPGQSCILLDPYYATYEQTIRAASARPIPVACKAEDGFQPDIDAIAAAIEPDTNAILINTPNNPTGAIYRRDRLEALASLCIERGIWLISDEVYDTQIWEGDFSSSRDLPGMADRTLVVNSLSKSHAMTGSRMGWLVAPRPVQERLSDLLIATNYGLPGFIQDAGEYAVRHGQPAEDDIVNRYRTRREAALKALGNGPGFRLVPPEGGMYIMLDIRPTGLSGVDFANRLLDDELIGVMPGESFGKATAGHLRIALTVPEAELTDALTRIARFAARLAETQPA